VHMREAGLHVPACLDTEVAAFRDRSLAGQAFRYLFLDATYCKARVDHRVVSQAVVVATGVAADGWHICDGSRPMGGQVSDQVNAVGQAGAGDTRDRSEERHAYSRPDP